MFQTPILLIIFNRLDTTKQVFEVIQKIEPVQLFIASDGPRKEKCDETEKCKMILSWVLANINWKCEIKTLIRDTNLGCGLGPATAISWFFEHVEEGIILEDDCVPDLSFFPYCESLLSYYRNNSQISIISGVNFDISRQFSPKDESYFFSIFPFTWGWATWRKNWTDYDFKIRKWNKLNKKVFLSFLFKESEYQLIWHEIFDKIHKSPPNDIWDFQFFFKCFLHKQYSIVPRLNLVRNIGIGDEATHTIDTEDILTNLPASSIEEHLNHPHTISRNVSYDIFLQDINFGKAEVISTRKKIKRWIRRHLIKTKEK